MTQNPAANAPRDLNGQFTAYVSKEAPTGLLDQSTPEVVPAGTAEFDGTEFQITLTNGEVISYVPDSTPDEYDDTFVKEVQDGVVRVSWTTHDDFPAEYEWVEGDSFETFTSEWDRDAYIEVAKSNGIPAENIFIVDKYDHGSVHYSVSNTAGYPDRRWDVAPSGVFILDGKGETGAEVSVETANALLDDFSNFCNGDVYNVNSVDIDVTTGEQIGEEESCGGYIGSDHAKEALTYQ